MGRLWRQMILAGFDLMATLLAIVGAFVVRFAFEGRTIPEQYLLVYVSALPVLLPLRLVIFHAFGLYRQIWSHASVPELLRVLWAVSIDSIMAAVVIYGLLGTGFPRSVLAIGWLLKLGFLGSIRLLLRVRRDWYSLGKNRTTNSQKTLIFGAGDAGTMLVREFAKHPELGRHVVGFIDDDPMKQGYNLVGKPVLGKRTQLREVVKKHGISHLVIAVPSASSGIIREVVDEGRSLGLHIQTLPGLYELVNGKVSVSQIRDVQIEDLLGRDEIRVDLQAIAAYLTGEVILVTGAGGSIGSELCRQVSTYSPRELILLGHGENSIYEVDLELRRSYPSLALRPVIADIQDEDGIRRAFERFQPGVVFHAAAHKHVPLMEQNPEAAIKNNVFGTLNLVRAAHDFHVKRFVLISSDKAVNPASVMGYTKRAAEHIVQSYSRFSKTVFVAVRFGNVLGSRGSVIPLFQKQIASGGPVTVTDPGMFRYFMTIPEAVQLVIQAASMGVGGETFVLDMGKPVRILDLARDLIRLSGFEPDVDIPIVFAGIREGEKLHEELLTAEEGTLATRHERIYMARVDSIPDAALQGSLEVLRHGAETGAVTNDWLRQVVNDMVAPHKLRGAVGSRH